MDALGPGVQGFTEGQRVIVLNSQGGNWAEYVVQPAAQLLPVPDDLSDEQAASFMINPASAVMMVRRVLAVPPGEWLLQSAAGSEIGRMIVRLARNDGIHTVNVARRREAAAELENLGADDPRYILAVACLRSSGSATGCPGSPPRGGANWSLRSSR